VLYIARAQQEALAFFNETAERRQRFAAVEPFTFTPTGVDSISSGSPHVRPTGRTCGKPNEIKEKTHPKTLMIPLFFVIGSARTVLTQPALDPNRRGNARTVTPTRCQRRRFEGPAQQGEAQRANDGATETPPLPTQQAHSFFFGRHRSPPSACGH